jgi:hypothetical protein
MGKIGEHKNRPLTTDRPLTICPQPSTEVRMARIKTMQLLTPGFGFSSQPPIFTNPNIPYYTEDTLINKTIDITSQESIHQYY